MQNSKIFQGRQCDAVYTRLEAPKVTIPVRKQLNNDLSLCMRKLGMYAEYPFYRTTISLVNNCALQNQTQEALISLSRMYMEQQFRNIR